jgi:hypothetical protein
MGESITEYSKQPQLEKIYVAEDDKTGRSDFQSGKKESKAGGGLDNRFTAEYQHKTECISKNFVDKIGMEICGEHLDIPALC